MNRTLLLYTLSVLISGTAIAQMPVTDAGAHVLIEKQTQSVLLEWAEQLKQMKDQLDTMREHLDTAKQLKEAVGNPAEAAGLIDQQFLGGELGNSGLGDTFSELADVAGSGQSLAGDVQQLYEPIDFQNPLQAPDLGGSDPFAKYQAVESAFNNYANVLEDSQRRGKQLDAEIQESVARLDAATTDAEAQKIQGEINALQDARARLQKETDDAAAQMNALHKLNQNYEAMQKQQSVNRQNAEQKQINESAKSTLQEIMNRNESDFSLLKKIYSN